MISYEEVDIYKFFSLLLIVAAVYLLALGIPIILDILLSDPFDDHS